MTQMTSLTFTMKHENRRRPLCCLTLLGKMCSLFINALTSSIAKWKIKNWRTHRCSYTISSDKTSSVLSKESSVQSAKLQKLNKRLMTRLSLRSQTKRRSRLSAMNRKHIKRKKKNLKDRQTQLKLATRKWNASCKKRCGKPNKPWPMPQPRSMTWRKIKKNEVKGMKHSWNSWRQNKKKGRHSWGKNKKREMKGWRKNKKRETEFKTSKTKVFTMRIDLAFWEGMVTSTSLELTLEADKHVLGGTPPIQKPLITVGMKKNVRHHQIIE